MRHERPRPPGAPVSRGSFGSTTISCLIVNHRVKDGTFVALATELGLQLNVFERCLNSGRFREEITQDLQDGLKLGIMSTPTFFINGRPLVGAQPVASFQALIDTLLAQQPLS